jgi:hypothetical protein
VKLPPDRLFAAAKARLGWKLPVALAITVFQISFALLATGEGWQSRIPGTPPALRARERLIADGTNPLEKLCVWDCLWYWHIAEEGYRSTLPPAPLSPDQANVAFFPATPLAARAVRAVTGVSWPMAVLLASWLAAVGFWWYLLALLASRGSRPWVTAFAAFAIFAHPAALYLVAGYSESLFLMALLGYVYWSERARSKESVCRIAAALAALHGFIMSATRIVGIPLAGYPAVRTLVFSLLTQNVSGRTLGKDFLLSAVAAAGGFAFLVFCQLQFGQWNLYFETQRIGWGLGADYLFPLHLLSYRWSGRNAGAVMICALALLAVIAAEVALHRRSREQSAERQSARLSALYLALGLFYISASATAGANFVSFVRYSLPVLTILALIAADLWSLARLPRRVEWAIAVILFLAFSYSLAYWGFFKMAVHHFHGFFFA